MKRFLKFVIKELFHIIRDKRSLVILFGMPLVQIILFGFAITNEINNVEIAVLDNSKDVVSQKLINKISASKYFSVNIINSEKEIKKNFKKGKIKAVLVILPEFGKSLTKYKQAQVQLLTDAAEPNTANTIVGYVNAILNDFSQEESNANTLPYAINIQTRMIYNKELKSVFMFVPGVMTIILMLVSAMMTSISITREKETGTMEVLLVSPIKPYQVIIGKVVPYILLSVLIASLILWLSVFIFKMPVQGSWLLLSAESLLFIVVSLSLGILISTISATQQTAMMISLMGLMLPTILLSGFIFPISSMPLPLQIISNVLPAKWFVIIIKAIMLKGAGFAVIWKETLALIIMTIVFLGISIKKYKIRLE